MYRFVAKTVYLSVLDEALNEIGPRHEVSLSQTRLSSLNSPYIENVQQMELGPFDEAVTIFYFGISEGKKDPSDLKRIPKGIFVPSGKTILYPPGFFRIYLDTF